MVDTTDLKSVDLNGRVGSSPTTPSSYKISKLILSFKVKLKKVYLPV